MAWYQRNAGRHAEAERLLNEALSIARGQGFLNEIAPLTIDLARSRFDVGDYGRARDLLGEVVAAGRSSDFEEALIRLAAVHIGLGDLTTAASDLDRASLDVEKRRRGLLPLFHLTLGELAMARGRLAEARTDFRRAAALWTDNYPDPASVASRAYVGVLDGAGRSGTLKGVEAAVTQAKAMGIVGLETRVRLLLAQAFVEARRGAEAVAALGQVPDLGRVGPELRAFVHYWRGRALDVQGDAAASRLEADAAIMLMNQLRSSLPARDQESFAARADVRRVLSTARRSEVASGALYTTGR